MPIIQQTQKQEKRDPNKYYLVDANYSWGFPADIPFGREDMSASEKENTKLGYRYGHSVAKAIEYDWFGGSCRFSRRNNRFTELRKYALGIQSDKKYRDVLCFEGDFKWQKLDWTPLKIIPKFVDIVVNGIMERLYSIKATAVDTEATNMRQKEKDRIEADMIAKPFLQDLKSMGYDAFSMPEDELPQSDEELGFYIEKEFALPIEIAVEKTVNLIMLYNDIDIISERIVRDIVEIGVGWGRHYIDPVAGIKLKYVNPETFVHSYTESPDFNNSFFMGIVEPITIAELKRTYIENDIDWKTVQKQCQNFYTHIGRAYDPNISNLDNFEVMILSFSYLTSKDIVYKKKLLKGGAFKMIKKDYGYAPPESERSRQQKKTAEVDTWMEGVLVLGTDLMLDWRESSNIIRPKGKLHKPESPFIGFAPKIYEGYYDSLVARMITPADQFQLQHMKLQHLISRIQPDGAYFDVEGLQNIDLGDGNTYTPKEAMKLYFETGNVVGRSLSESGMQGNPKPVQANFTSGQSDKINNIIGAMNFYMQQLVESIGANQQATNPDPDALLGVQKLAALNSNQATVHIRRAILNILKRFGSGILHRLTDAWQYSEFKDFVIGGIGRLDYETIKSLEDLNLHDIGVMIELRPDAEEMAKLLEDVSIAIQSGQININDKIDVMNKSNFKDASQLLKLRIQKNQKQKMEEQKQTIRENEESQIRISQAASQSKMEAAQFESSLKQQEIALQGQNKLAEIDRLADRKSDLMEQEYYYKMGITDKQVQASTNKQNVLEDRKDKREKMKATHQSQQSFQRKNNLPPIDFNQEAEEETPQQPQEGFESNFDNMRRIEI